MPTMNNQIISMHRGDSLSYPIFINIGTKALPMRYALQEGDTLVVGVMEPNQPFGRALMMRELTKDDANAHGDAVFSLSPEDTERMLPGMYYYEAKLYCLRDGSEMAYTVVPRRKFVLVE